MKNFLGTFVAVLLAVGLALFAYDRLVLAPRLEQAGEAARVSLDEARAEAARIATDLDASVDRTVSDARQAFDTQVADEDRRRAGLAAEAEAMRATAQAAEALMRASMLKAAIAEHYQANGAWPTELADLGLGGSDDLAGGPVAGMALEPGGVIAITMRAEVAPGGQLRLAPTASRNGMIEWRCRVRDFPAATRLPACKA